MTADRAILTYHSLDASGSPISLEPAAFERHLDFLAAAGIPALPLAGLDLEGADGGPAIALTFDDGFANFAVEAWPRLRARGFGATLFVVAGLVGGDNRWGGREQRGIPTLPLLGWDELGRLAEEGLELGCHSLSHPDLRDLDPERLAAETAGAAAMIEKRTGRRPRSFCYPFGHLDPRARAAAGAAFDRAVTTEFRLLGRREDPLRLPRLDAFYFRRPGLLEGFGSGGFRAFVRRRRLLRRVRSLLSGPRVL